MKKLIQKALLIFFKDKRGHSRRLLAFLSAIWPHSILRIWYRFFRELSPVCRERGLRNLLFKYMDKPKKSLPSMIIISLTNRCNLTCLGCSCHRDKLQSLSRNLVDEIISFAKKDGPKVFVLMGGEPLLWKDLPWLLERHQDAYFEINTNGILMDESLADFLSEIGNSAMYFSLEGPEDETDRRRGNGVFNKVSQAMQQLQERGVPLGANILVTPLNFDAVTSGSFVQALVKRGSLQVRYFPYKPVGDHPDLSLLLSPSQRKILYERVIQIRKTFPVIAVDHENDMPLGGCFATNGIGIYISAEGRLEPCGILHYSDSVLTEGQSLDVAFQNSPLLKGMRSLYRSQAGCLLHDRPRELLELLKNIFPETYKNFPDIALLEQYAEMCTCCLSPSHPEQKKDMFTKIGGFLFKTVLK